VHGHFGKLVKPIEGNHYEGNNRKINKQQKKQSNAPLLKFTPNLCEVKNTSKKSKRNVPNAKAGLLLRQHFSQLITGLGEALQHAPAWDIVLTIFFGKITLQNQIFELITEWRLWQVNCNISINIFSKRWIITLGTVISDFKPLLAF